MKNVLKKTKRAFIFASLPLVVVLIVLCIAGYVEMLETALYSLGIVVFSAYTMFKEPEMFIRRPKGVK